MGGSCASCGRCNVCDGKGPRLRFAQDERGDLMPLPLEPCVGCGLQYPIYPVERTLSTPSPSLSFSALLGPYFQSDALSITA